MKNRTKRILMNLKNIIHSPKRLFSALMALVGVTVNFGEISAKGEVNLGEKQVIKSKQDFKQQESIAERVFNWKETGKTYNLSSSSYLAIKADGRFQEFLTAPPTSEDNVDVNINHYRENEPPFYVAGLKYSFFKDGNGIIDYSIEHNIAVPNRARFKNGERIEVVEVEGLPSYIMRLEHLTDAQKDFLINLIETTRNLTIDEVATIMLMIDPNEKNWYSDKPLSISEAKFQSGKIGNLVLQKDVFTLLFIDDDGNIKMDLLKLKQLEDNSGVEIVHLLSDIYFSKPNFEDVNPFFLKNYNVKKFTGSVRKGGNIIFFNNFSQIFISKGIDELEPFKVLEYFVKKATVDDVYFDEGLLLEYVYPQIPEKYQVDYSWFFSQTGKSIIEKRMAAFESRTNETQSSYILRSAPENFNYITRMNKQNIGNLPERRDVARTIPTEVRDTFIIYGFDPNGRSLSLPIGKPRIINYDNPNYDNPKYKTMG
jgi:hypothetical protein